VAEETYISRVAPFLQTIVLDFVKNDTFNSKIIQHVGVRISNLYGKVSK